MNGPDGKPIHAELTLRGTTLMLGPEMPQMGSRSRKPLARHRPVCICSLTASTKWLPRP